MQNHPSREFEIKQIYKKVGLALYKLHETAGLSHLDIKEENILIDPDTLHPVLIDFATCRISVPPVHCQKIHTKMVGSPYFCAPEVVGCRASKSRDSQKAGNSSGKAGLSGNNGFSAVNDQFSRLGFEDNNELRNIRVKDYSKCDIYSFGVALFSSFTGDYGARGIFKDQNSNLAVIKVLNLFLTHNWDQTGFGSNLILNQNLNLDQT